MPSKPKRPCRRNGCKALTTTGLCDEHKRQARRDDDARRGDDRQFYGKPRWRKIRKLRLEIEPLCRFCKDEKPPKLTVADTVDHIKGRHEFPDLAFDLENTRSLCKTCHDRHTAMTQGFGRNGRVGYNQSAPRDGDTSGERGPNSIEESEHEQPTNASGF